VRLSADRAASLRVAFTLAGATLLVLSELTDLLESEIGLNWVNLFFALPIALIAVAFVAVGGDILLEAIERRRGRRPGRWLAIPILAGLGLGASIEIALHHARQAPHLDASMGLAGGALLLIAAGLQRHASASLKKGSTASPATGRRLPELRGSRSHPPTRIVRRAGKRSTTRS
jgi:hypothetical protein